jgi:hypothetical protein
MRELLIVVFLAAAAYFGYDSYNQKQKAEDLQKEIASLQEKQGELEKKLEEARKMASRQTIGSNPVGAVAGIGGTNPSNAVNRTIQCYFCQGAGKYQTVLAGRSRSTSCNICGGKGNRRLRYPNTYTICGSRENGQRSSGGGINTCKGMGKLAREISKKISTAKIASKPSGSSRYTAVGCTNCNGKGVVKQMVGERIN